MKHGQTPFGMSTNKHKIDEKKEAQRLTATYRKKLVVTVRRCERIYKRTAEPSVTFFENEEHSGLCDGSFVVVELVHFGISAVFVHKFRVGAFFLDAVFGEYDYAVAVFNRG